MAPDQSGLSPIRNVVKNQKRQNKKDDETDPLFGDKVIRRY